LLVWTCLPDCFSWSVMGHWCGYIEQHPWRCTPPGAAACCCCGAAVLQVWCQCVWTSCAGLVSSRAVSTLIERLSHGGAGRPVTRLARPSAHHMHRYPSLISHSSVITAHHCTQSMSLTQETAQARGRSPTVVGGAHRQCSPPPPGPAITPRATQVSHSCAPVVWPDVAPAITAHTHHQLGAAASAPPAL
jgi:hypothetical protein